MDLSKKNYDTLFDILTKLRPRYPENFEYHYNAEEINERIEWNDPMSLIDPPNVIYRMKDDKIIYFSNQRGLTSTDITEDIFSNLTDLIELHLDLEVLDIPESVFSDLIKLEHLTLGINKCSMIPQLLFQNLSKLIVLNFETDCSDLPSTLFDPLYNLRELCFRISKANYLPTEIFSNLKILNSLFIILRNEMLIPEILKNLEKLKILSIHSMNLKFLQIEIFHNLLNLEELRIYTSKNLILSNEHLLPLKNLKRMRLSKNIILQGVKLSKYKLVIK